MSAQQRCTCTPVTAAGVMVEDPHCPMHSTPPVAFTVAPGLTASGQWVPTSYASVGGDQTRFNEKTHAEGRALLRVATELRSYLTEAPTDDPDVQSLLRDCDTLERVGNWLASTNAVTFSDGISVR